jgi:hypothetical protein
MQERIWGDATVENVFDPQLSPNINHRNRFENSSLTAMVEPAYNLNQGTHNHLAGVHKWQTKCIDSPTMHQTTIRINNHVRRQGTTKLHCAKW